jgi:hypothetical protein
VLRTAHRCPRQHRESARQGCCVLDTFFCGAVLRGQGPLSPRKAQSCNDHPLVLLAGLVSCPSASCAHVSPLSSTRNILMKKNVRKHFNHHQEESNATSDSTWNRVSYHGAGRPCPPLRGRFFHKVLRMHMLCPPTAPLMSPGPSCRLRQGHGRFLCLLQRRNRGPWFWDKAALRQGFVAQQRHQHKGGHHVV